MHQFINLLSLSKVSIENTEIGQRSLTCIGLKMWHTVPKGIKNLSVNAFKARYKAYLIDQYE